jgi:cytochrome c-type biogenesis protein CcmH/NrfF
MSPLHLGPLHPVEQALTLLLAFGPFVLLALVVVVRRRQDAREAALEEGETLTAPDRPAGHPGGA